MLGCGENPIREPARRNPTGVRACWNSAADFEIIDMSNSLVIVESPAKAKTIGKYLGKNYVVKASLGHVKDLPKKDLAVDVEHGFEPPTL